MLKRLAILASLLAAAGLAQSPELDRFVTDQMSRQHIPGLGLAVIQKDKPPILKGYGQCNLELNISCGPASGFKIGPVTKQFIATAVMVPVDEGKVKHDEPL